MATLVAAIYKGYSAQWLVAAFGLSAAWRLVAQYRDDSTIKSPQQVAFVALAAWAFYKQVGPPGSWLLLGAGVHGLMCNQEGCRGRTGSPQELHAATACRASCRAPRLLFCVGPRPRLGAVQVEMPVALMMMAAQMAASAVA